MAKRQLTGIIISNKMQKTVVVKVERLKKYPKYKKKYKLHKKYLAHIDPPAGGGDYKIGDRVIIEECRPISKKKKWRVIKHI